MPRVRLPADAAKSSPREFALLAQLKPDASGDVNAEVILLLRFDFFLTTYLAGRPRFLRSDFEDLPVPIWRREGRYTWV